MYSGIATELPIRRSARSLTGDLHSIVPARRSSIIRSRRGGSVEGCVIGRKDILMLAVAVAVSLAAATTCPATDARAELLALHEAARQAHLRGDAAPIAAATADE